MFQSSSLSLLALLALMVSGCAGGPRAYVGIPRPSAEVAIIKPSPESADFDVSFVEYGEGESTAAGLKVGDSVNGNRFELRLAPATYTVKVHCSKGNAFASPSVRVRAAQGVTYEIACHRTGLDERRVRAAIRRTYTTEPAPLAAAAATTPAR